jgi:hypothetical protein
MGFFGFHSTANLVLALLFRQRAATPILSRFLTHVEALGRGGTGTPDGDEPCPLAKVITGGFRGWLAERRGVNIIRAAVHVDQWSEAGCNFCELFNQRELEGMFSGVMLGFGSFKLS